MGAADRNRQLKVTNCIRVRASAARLGVFGDGRLAVPGPDMLGPRPGGSHLN